MTHANKQLVGFGLIVLLLGLMGVIISHIQAPMRGAVNNMFESLEICDNGADDDSDGSIDDMDSDCSTDTTDSSTAGDDLSGASEICDNGADDDSDGSIDDMDSDCSDAGEPTASEPSNDPFFFDATDPVVGDGAADDLLSEENGTGESSDETEGAPMHSASDASENPEETDAVSNDSTAADETAEADSLFFTPILSSEAAEDLWNDITETVDAILNTLFGTSEETGN